MFVYQNKDGNICVTFKDNKPVESPEYIIAIDEDAQALYALAGEIGAPTVDDGADDGDDEGGKDDNGTDEGAGGTDTPGDDGDDTVTETTDTGAITGDSATETEIE